MKKHFIIVSFILFLFSAKLIAQNALIPGLSSTFFQQNRTFGYRISNQIQFPICKQNLRASFDFSYGFGNKNIDLNNNNNYLFEYDEYFPLVPQPAIIGPTISDPFPIPLKSFTSTNVHFTLKMGYYYSLPFIPNIKIICGIYGSHITTRYLLEPIDDLDIDFYLLEFDLNQDDFEYVYRGTGVFDLAIPVSLKYLNYGILLGINYQLDIIDNKPIELEIVYEHGRYSSSVISLGINLPLQVQKRND